jgi:glutamate-ammonia-ligase adenylyltransferase
MQLALDEDDYQQVMHSLAVMALGKLGASELNFSSDIDLVYICVNPEIYKGDYQELQNKLVEGIRHLNSALEAVTEEGFLYRVDMKLRPWGSSGPMVMAIDDTEHYYEASSEPWERFAWLRARCIAGLAPLGADMKQRMRPFVFMRSLSTDDLERFIEIKNDMSKARKRKGYWNVKVGEGGIRDIEFFIQMLQVVNASKYDSLQTTNTLEALAGLGRSGLISSEDEQQLHRAYLYLRRLENRLQMIDERQTHNLPDSREQRLRLARSLDDGVGSNDAILGSFERELFINQSIAKRYFERILPGE